MSFAPFRGPGQERRAQTGPDAAAQMLHHTSVLASILRQMKPKSLKRHLKSRMNAILWQASAYIKTSKYFKVGHVFAGDRRELLAGPKQSRFLWCPS